MEHKEPEQRAPHTPDKAPRREQPAQPSHTDKDQQQPAQSDELSERGATEEQVIPLKPPMTEPIDPASAGRDKDDDEIDPRDELTPG